MDTNFYNAASPLSEAEITANEAAVRALYQQLIEAWGDTDTYAALFTEDGDYIAFDGSHARGRTEIARAHRPLFEGILKGSRLVEVGIPVEVRFLSPDVALVHRGGQCSGLTRKSHRAARFPFRLWSQSSKKTAGFLRHSRIRAIVRSRKHSLVKSSPRVLFGQHNLPTNKS